MGTGRGALRTSPERIQAFRRDPQVRWLVWRAWLGATLSWELIYLGPVGTAVV